MWNVSINVGTLAAKDSCCLLRLTIYAVEGYCSIAATKDFRVEEIVGWKCLNAFMITFLYIGFFPPIAFH